MKKNIWILHHYADPPDGHWTGTYDLYKFLVKMGHKVTVFSSSFSHYTRKEERLKPGENYRVQDYNGMRFIFVRTFAHQTNNWRRLMNMLTYAFRSYRYGLKYLKDKPDIIIGTTPHPFCVHAARLLAKKKKADFMMELHDLWLEFILDTKILSPKNPLSWIIKKTDEILYRDAKKIMYLWPQMNEYLKLFNVPQEKMVWLPLGIDFSQAENIPYTPDSSKKDITIVCTARFGPASNIDEILKATLIARQKGYDNIHIKLIGDGPERANLEKFALDNNLHKIQFTGMIPKEQVRSRLAEADACIAGLPDLPNYKKYGTIPTKILDYLTSNRPSIFITSIPESLVTKSKGGFVALPNQPEALADIFIKLSQMTPDERIQIGKNAMNYMREHHNLEKLAEKIDNFL